MKTDEEMGLDRGGVELETDDEENQAHDDDADYSPSSSASYGDSPPYHDEYAGQGSSYITSWPQSYRQSIDMLSNVNVQQPNAVMGSIIRGGSSLIIAGSFFRPDEAQLTKPLVGQQSAHDQGHGFTPSAMPSTPAEYMAASRFSFRKASFQELPPSPKCSSAQAVVNGLNVLCGVGLLTTPYAIKEGGWLGMVVLFALGSISCYTGILLKECLDSSPGLQTYPDIGQAAFGMTGRLCISVILYMELYACCVEYITLVGDSLTSLFPAAHISYIGLDLPAHQLFAITTAILVLPTVWLRDLSLLSYLSAGGVIASILVVISLFWVGVVDGVGFRPGGTALDLSNLPVALGLYGFCYSGHSVFPNICSSMQKKSQFPKVLIFSFLLCTTLYAGVAVAGYMMFGEFTKSQFTLNLPSELLMSKVAVWTTVVNPLTKYALTMTPVALSLEEILPLTCQSHCLVMLIRTVLVFSTLLVALSLPYFGIVMALLGSIFTMLVALILPCACYLSIQRRTLSHLQVTVCVLIIFVGVACSCIGSYTSIKQILDKLLWH